MPDIKCDIIIPVWNERELTEKCIESIQKNTTIPYKIILVDNASDAPTASYLKELSEENGAHLDSRPGFLGRNTERPLPIRTLKGADLWPRMYKGSIILIRNEENAGFPKAVNQGIIASNAPYICVLNNDTVVYKNWLKEMISVAESDPLIGIVNPSSNNLGQPKPLEGFSGKWIEVSSCIGFCMLIKKEVIEKIGRFDEIYSPGNFEDTDFSRRAAKAGYKCVMAKGSYVYHAQNTGFKKRKDWDEKFRRNLDIFNQRWGKIKRIAYIIKDIKEDEPHAIEIDIRNYLKEGNRVYIFIKKGSLAPHLEEHGSLRVIEIGRFMFNIKVLWLTGTKKKRFDKVIIPSFRK